MISAYSSSVSRLGLEQDRVRDGDLADVVQQEAELDLRGRRELDAHRARELEAVGGHPLGVLVRVGVARLDRVGERAHGRAVGAAQPLRVGALGLEDLAQVGRVALELPLAGRGLALDPLEAGAELLDRARPARRMTSALDSRSVLHHAGKA